MEGPWEFEAHPAVWLLIAAIVALGYYAVRHIGPLVVADGQTIVTKRQRRCFALAVFLLWVAADWPMHDIAEDYLYSVHMAQHLLIAFIVPPLFLLATPEWLARLVVVDGGTVSRVLRVLTRPVLAAVIFNALQILSHWSAVVNLSVSNGVFHYTIHLAVFFSALLMWFCVVGPLPELQISEPAKMVYLFTSSIVPTVPAGWLTFAEGVVYSAYDHADPLWGISHTDDQQAAGAIMKVVGGFYLWALITIRYFRYTSGRRERDLVARRARRQPTPNRERPAAYALTPDLTFDTDLTFNDVQRAFEENPEPRREAPS